MQAKKSFSRQGETEQFNGRERQTATFFSTGFVCLTLRRGGFAPRHLNRSTLSGENRVVKFHNHKIKFFIFALGFATLLVCADRSIFAQKRTPRFEDYPVTKTYKGKTAPPKLGKREVELYEDRFKWTVENQKVNFAGRYIVTTWSCGSTCLFGTVIDAKTGKPSWWKVRLNYRAEKPVE